MTKQFFQFQLLLRTKTPFTFNNSIFFPVRNCWISLVVLIRENTRFETNQILTTYIGISTILNRMNINVHLCPLGFLIMFKIQFHFCFIIKYLICLFLINKLFSLHGIMQLFCTFNDFTFW